MVRYGMVWYGMAYGDVEKDAHKRGWLHVGRAAADQFVLYVARLEKKYKIFYSENKKHRRQDSSSNFTGKSETD